jgi:peptidoglycan lytic transglycosylase A
LLIPNDSQIKTFFVACTVLAVLAGFVVFSRLLAPFYEKQHADAAYGEPGIDFRLADFYELHGWQQDDSLPAFAAFLRSCEALLARGPTEPANPQEYLGDRLQDVTLAGTVADWRLPCGEAAEINGRYYSGIAVKRGAFRAFFENNFRPVQILQYRTPLPDSPTRRKGPKIEETGLFTGYFEPVYNAARTPGKVFTTPAYPRPDDLVEVDLGVFREELSGQRIAGKLAGHQLVPYADRKVINEGVLNAAAAPIAWLDANDLFFLQIQGSGRLRFNDGSELRIGYDGQNGHAYTSIGRVMVEREIMPLEDVSMASIRAWLDGAGADNARALREENASYVFFRELDPPQDNLGPPGALGVALTPQRSLAVDRRYHALGAPVWVDIEPVDGAGPEPIRRLMVAQDTGGAIRGPVRGDVFWGTGEDAGAIAGAMKARGEIYVLVPRNVAAQLPRRSER